MNFGVLTINDFSFHPNMRLRQAAAESGHDIILINPYDILCSLGNSRFGFTIENISKELDVIMPRQGSPMGDYGLVLLRQFMHSGLSLVNGLQGVTIARNQFVTLQKLVSSNLLVPSTLFITKPDSFLQAVKHLGGFPVVIKQVDGMGGDGVIKVNHKSEAIAFLDQHLKNKKGLLVQEFIPPRERTDIRVLVIGEKIAGAMALVPDGQDFRTNIHQKGHARSVDLKKSLAKLALKAARACHLEIAGIDFIVEKGCAPLIIEVNYSPGFKGLETATGQDIAKQVLDYVTSTYNK
ncbi:MAG TPA: RimK family alpha-L-glutamate ligase [Desulfobacterales bacterium]|nr:RimK family alpha-L-glutamate ligase [Desulfobacterales bacterium]